MTRQAESIITFTFDWDGPDWVAADWNGHMICLKWCELIEKQRKCFPNVNSFYGVKKVENMNIINSCDEHYGGNQIHRCHRIVCFDDATHPLRQTISSRLIYWNLLSTYNLNKILLYIFFGIWKIWFRFFVVVRFCNHSN